MYCLDTNIVICAYDGSAGKKHEMAQMIVMNLWNSGQGVLSTQVLQEFYVSVTKKIPKPLNIKLAKDIARDFLKWDVIVNDGEAILGAIDIQLKYNYSFWDSMIIHAAISSGAALLLSEDLSHGQSIGGVTIKNPFRSN